MSTAAPPLIFQPQIETLARPSLEALQLERLRDVMTRVRANVPLYAERLAGCAVPYALDDVAGLPFTRKSDLRDSYPLGMLAVPRHEVARIHASSGTSGNPTITAYTTTDLAVWAEVCARSLAMAGAMPGDMFQVAWGYGLFTGGLGMHAGAERLGCAVVPASSGNTLRQLQLLEALPVAGIGCTPSYALYLAERMRSENKFPSALRLAVCGAESWTLQMRAQLEAALGVIATNIYGLTEVIGPGVAQECAVAKAGMHVQEDHFLCEVIDPDTGQRVADGTRGELVITTLTREAMPVLRYRTGDLTAMTREPCACGRTTARIDWLTGRVDDMIIVRGVNVFPTAIEEVLLGFDELSPNYRIFVDRADGGLDEVTIEVEHHPGASIDAEILAARLRLRLNETLLVSASTAILAPNTIERVEAGKVRRVFDRRNPA